MPTAAFPGVAPAEPGRPAASPPAEEERLLAVLRCPVLRALSGSTQQALASRLEPVALQEGQVLFRQADFPDALYLVAEGRVQVVRTTEEGEERILAVLGPGELVGEMGLLDGIPRTATVVALEPCLLWRLDRASFFALARQDAGLLLALSELQGRRRRASGETVAGRDEEEVVREVVQVLRRLALVGAGGSGGAPVQRLRVTCEELGSLVGSPAEVVSRALQRLQRDGVVVRVGFAGVWVDRSKLLEHTLERTGAM